MIKGVDDKLVSACGFAINSGGRSDLSRPLVNGKRRTGVLVVERRQRVTDAARLTDIAIISRHRHHIDWSWRFFEDRGVVDVGVEAWTIAVNRVDNDDDGDGIEQRRSSVIARLDPHLQAARQAPVLGQRPPDLQLPAVWIDNKPIVDVAADDVVVESGHAWS